MEETRKSRRGKVTRAKTPRSTVHPASTSRVPVQSEAAPSAPARQKATRKTAPKTKTKTKTKTKATQPATREEWVRVAAYYRAERRGFAPGHDLEDWFAAEAGWAAIPTPG